MFSFSSLRESSQWVSKTNNRGEIFLLELQDFKESPEQTTTDKECLCTCSDWATDDTGYGTDTDLYSSFRRGDDESLCQSTKILSEFSEISDVITNSTNVVARNTDCQVIEGGNNFTQAEEDIDSLFRNVSVVSDSTGVNSETDILVPNDLFSTDISQLFIGSSKGPDFTKADKTSVVSVMSEPDNLLNTSLNEEIPHFSRSVRKNKSSNKCDCALKHKESLKSDYVVSVKLRPEQRIVNGMSTVELCEYVLGFVPGHYGSANQGSNHSHRRRDRRIKVRGILPNGVAAKWPNIHVGEYQYQKFGMTSY